MPLQSGLLGIPPRSRAMLHWRAKDLSLAPLTGQTPSYVRTAVGASTGLDGAAITVGYGALAWRAVNLNLDGLTRELALTTGGAGEQIFWPIDNGTGGLDQRALTVYTVFIIRDGTTVGGRILQVGNNTGARLIFFIAASGQLQVQHDNGTSSVFTSSIAVANGNVVEARVVLNQDGSVLAGYRIGAWDPLTVSGADSVTTTSGANAIAAWSAQRLWVAGVSGTNNSSLDVACVKMLSGAQSMQTMRDLF